VGNRKLSGIMRFWAHIAVRRARLKKQKKIIKGIGILGFLEIPDTHFKGGFYRWRYSK